MINWLKNQPRPLYLLVYGFIFIVYFFILPHQTSFPGKSIKTVLPFAFQWFQYFMSKGICPTTHTTVFLRDTRLFYFLFWGILYSIFNTLSFFSAKFNAKKSYKIVLVFIVFYAIFIGF